MVSTAVMPNGFAPRTTFVGGAKAVAHPGSFKTQVVKGQSVGEAWLKISVYPDVIVTDEPAALYA